MGDIDEDTTEAMDTKGGSEYARDEQIQPDNEFYEEDDKDKEDRNISITQEKVENGSSEPASNSADSALPNPSNSTELTPEERKEIEELNQLV